MKVKVASTSTSCLDYYQEPHNIDMIRIKLLDGNKEYLDGTEIKAEPFYERMSREKSWVPKTSQPSVGDVVAYFEGLIEAGYDEVFVTTLSSHLSGSFNAIYQAGELVKDKLKVTAYDTLSVCFSEGYFALEADRLFKAGKTTQEVVRHLDFLKANNTIFFAVDDLTQLVNNGRLSGAAAFIGRLLQIKPILQVNKEGKIVSIEKKRTLKNALGSIAEHIRNYTEGKQFFAHIIYAGNAELKTYFKQVLKDELGLENLYEAPSTPVVGAHVGGGVIGIGIFIKA